MDSVSGNLFLFLVIDGCDLATAASVGGATPPAANHQLQQQTGNVSQM